MIRNNKILNDTKKSTPTWSSGTAWLPALTLLMIWSCSSGCKSPVRVISADQTETFLKGGQAFTAPVDGVFLPDARYQRYRRAVADKILEQQNSH